jgi:ATP-dependent exoDNAse (exonuclease V) beta subunit
MKSRFQEIDDKTRKELLKEVLRRANKKEKQEYEQIGRRQATNAKRILDIMQEFEELTEESKRNKFPEKNSKNDGKRASEMSAEEFNEWMDRSSKYFDDSFAWSCKCIQNNTERIKLVEEFLKLLIELWTLEANEKWLLISIALRSQPNLMRFIEGGNAK